MLGGFLVLGVASRFFGDDGPRIRPGQADHVAFEGITRARGLPTRPDDAIRDATGDDIRDVLDAWYQEAFADPAAFGDGSFAAVAERFVSEAAVGFVEDRDALTIGSLAPQVASVRVNRANADVTLYFEDGVAAWATAAVGFDARAHLTDGGTDVLIEQRVSLVLEQRPEVGWVITNYYDASQRHRSRERRVDPSPSESSS